MKTKDCEKLADALTNAETFLYSANRSLQEAARLLIDNCDVRDSLLFEVRMARTQVYQLAHFSTTILQMACTRLERMLDSEKRENCDE